MANRIERKIYILKNREPRVIEYVQGASAVPIILTLMDYDIPEDATARVYVLKPSGKGEYDTATIEDNGILIDVKSTMFDETGTNQIQATVKLGDKTLITFSQEVDVSPNKVPGEVPESENKSNFLDEYITKLDDQQKAASEALTKIAEQQEAVEESASTASQAATKASEAERKAEASAEKAAEILQDVRYFESGLAITSTATGSQIVARDSAEWPLQAMTVYGRTEQVQTSGAQLIDFSRAVYQQCTLVDADTGTIKSNISNYYFCTIYLDYLADYFMANLGKTISFRADNNPNYISIVIYGERTSGGTTQEISKQGSRVSIIIAEDFTSIRQVELRVNRKRTDAFTDTTSLISGLMLYEGSEEKAYEPYTGGKPSPSPDYPQPIVSAGEVLSTGKNLFNANSREVRTPGGNSQNTETRSFNGSGIYVGLSGNNYYYPSNVTSYEVDDNSVTLCTVQSAYGIAFDFKTVPGQTYTIGNELSEKVGLSFYTEQGAFIEYSENNKSCTATAPDNAYWMIVLFRPTQGTSYTYTNIQLEKGTSATTYEPYTGGVPAAYPVGIEVAISGKNFVPQNAEYQKKFSVSLKANDTVTCSAIVTSSSPIDHPGGIRFYFADGTAEGRYFKSKSNNRSSCTITLKKDVVNAMFDYGECCDFQIELGSTATAYEPYRGRQTITLASNGLPGIPVTSGGNYTDADGQQWVCDTIEYRDGQAVYVKRVTEYAFAGNETFSDFTIVDKITFLLPHKPNIFALCTHATFKTSFEWANDNYILFVASAFNVTTVEEFKTWLTEHNSAGDPLRVLYAINTPTETPLTDTEAAQLAALHTYKPTTTITNDAGAGMEVEYVADTKAYIDNKFAELQNLIATTNAKLI